MESIKRQEQRLERPMEIQNCNIETEYFTYTTTKEYSRLGEYELPSFYIVTLAHFSKISMDNEFL